MLAVLAVLAVLGTAATATAADSLSDEQSSVKLGRRSLGAGARVRREEPTPAPSGGRSRSPAAAAAPAAGRGGVIGQQTGPEAEPEAGSAEWLQSRKVCTALCAPLFVLCTCCLR